MTTVRTTPVLEHVDDAATERNFNALQGALAALGIYAGTGSPNTVVTASVGAIYRRLDGGAATSIYIKESGTATNTGWVAK